MVAGRGAGVVAPLGGAFALPHIYTPAYICQRRRHAFLGRDGAAAPEDGEIGMRRLLFFFVGCLGAAGGVLGLILAVDGFAGPGPPPGAVIALSPGMGLSVALALGLVGPTIFAVVSALGIVGLAGRVSPLRLGFVAVGVGLVLASTRVG